MKNSLILLGNERIEVGILPAIGGRVVIIRQPGKENILKSDPELWGDGPKEKPALTAFSEYKAYNGHTVWLSPQLHWWQQQKTNKKRLNRMRDWPPDPFLEYADYKILEQTHSKVVMQSPASRITGMQLTKTIRLLKNKRVRFEVTGTNRRTTPVSWGLWFNTRLQGLSHAYSLLNQWGGVRLTTGVSLRSDPVEAKITNGYFHLSPQMPLPGKLGRATKALIYPGEEKITGFTHDQALVIHFKKHHFRRLHHLHGHIEFFNSISANPDFTLLELEYHAPWQTIPPGKSVRAHEEWEVLPYSGKATPKAHTDFLKKLPQ